MKKLVSFALAGVLLSACAGGGTTALPSGGTGAPTAPVAAARSSVTFTLKIPARMPPSATVRRPQYVSVSMLSLAVTLTAQNGTPVTSPQPHAVNVSTCPVVSGIKTCSLSVPASVGADTFTVATYDAAQSSSTPTTLAGNVLSTASASTTVVVDTANSLALTLNGVVHTISLALANAAPSSGATATIPLTVTARDADNNVIIGPGNYTAPISLANSDTSGATTLSTTSVTGPSTAITIAYTGVPTTATFSASAPGGITATSPSLTSKISRIYVADFADNEILTYSPSGASIAPTITTGVNGPQGITLDSSGNIYVANSLGGTVTKYSPAGTLLLTISGFSEPTCVAVSHAGKIYVSDDVLNTITAFTPTGAATTPTIAALNSPAGVSLDTAGDIYVGNLGAGSVPVYNASGALNRTITTGVYSPYDVAIDSTGKTYVADNGNPGNVTTYTAAGAQTTPTITLFNAAYLALDLSGNIYLTDGVSLHVYAPNGTQTSTVTTGGEPNGVAVY